MEESSDHSPQSEYNEEEQSYEEYEDDDFELDLEEQIQSGRFGMQGIGVQGLLNRLLGGRRVVCSQFPLLQSTQWDLLQSQELLLDVNRKCDSKLVSDKLYQMLLEVTQNEELLIPDQEEDTDKGTTNLPKDDKDADMLPLTKKKPPCILQAPLNRMLRAREMFGPFKRFQQRSLAGHNCPPFQPYSFVDKQPDRAYIGQFSKDGSLFWVAYQDSRIRLYDVERDFRLRKEVYPRGVHWAITDTSVSPDERFLAYSTMYSVIHMVNIGSSLDSVHSLANVNEIHHGLNVGWLVDMRDEIESYRFGVFSLDWASGNAEIAVGTNDNTFAIFDIERSRTVHFIQGHRDDLNAVVYLDESNNVLVTGSDDSQIYLWDRRTLPGTSIGAVLVPQGALVGHTEGITHIHSKGEGIHLVSNGKDQRAKLWDIRKCYSQSQVQNMDRKSIKAVECGQDYRWQQYPLRGYHVKHPYDISVQEYRGHTVQNTLIRAYMSPEFSTGGRYIYSGSATGKIHVYDTVTAHQVKVLNFHDSVVRDCSWHPYKQMFCSVGWDGAVVQWSSSPNKQLRQKMLRRQTYQDRF
eukprot:TRINITY_DN34071_c0_g1_i5.p1 TRINITY_DN34071_c0_g1~~TRINITY_DN34071_c0_g1_i5.p1  ORF type:complete len:586 (+),score=64.29 TRINITY_DN34071_c0_g1_i5:32-1759(+)